MNESSSQTQSSNSVRWRFLVALHRPCAEESSSRLPQEHLGDGLGDLPAPIPELQPLGRENAGRLGKLVGSKSCSMTDSPLAATLFACACPSDIIAQFRRTFCERIGEPLEMLRPRRYDVRFPSITIVNDLPFRENNTLPYSRCPREFRDCRLFSKTRNKSYNAHV
jgi:hypothetical protein